MKKFLFTILLSISVFHVFAAHIKGGFFTYQYLGPGITNPNNLRYKITLTIYMIQNPSAGQLTNPINFTIFAGNTSTQIDNPEVFIAREFDLEKFYDEPCISGDQAGIYYHVVVYELDNYELAPSNDGYTISNQRCCRINNMDNVLNSGNVGNTYTIQIPGTSSAVPNAEKNNSPDFPVNDTVVVCANSYFSYPFAATDADGDSLSYSLCDAYDGASSTVPAPIVTSSPPYSVVPYMSPYRGSQPMGPPVTINPISGLISGIAPPIVNTGEYVVTVCVAEYRLNASGIRVNFAQSRKELHVRVRDCVPLTAAILVSPFALNPEYVICDGYVLNFSNAVSNPSGTNYSWEFGDPTTGPLDSSLLPNPNHTFSDTGTYSVKLKVSINGQCADSAIAKIKVYPGFYSGFKNPPPLCKGIPIQFLDTTHTDYGTVMGWKWNFGNLSVNNDTSSLKNPTYVYPTPGTYNVRLIVGNSKGCQDTVFRDVIIVDKPSLTVFPHDTSYCGSDTLQLTATGEGNLSWLPGTSIIGASTGTPKVYPATTTKYFVTLFSGDGCINTDSVIVRPLNDLTNTITASVNSICEDDSITLTGSSNHSPVEWQWAPASSVLSTTGQSTKAFPPGNTNYTLNTYWGSHCKATAAKIITVTKLAVPNAGPNAGICLGQGSAQLNASGGDNYQWSPSAGLNDPAIPNPIATPSVTTTYKVSVGVTGCAKRKEDSLIVTVRDLPSLTLTNDTLICSIDTLKLSASGNGNVLWRPDYSISSLTSHTPLVSPDVPTRYFVKLTDAFGCITNDSVFVDVRLFITVDAGRDTTICKTDAITHPNSEALQYKWTPALYLNDPLIKNPVAIPLTNQTYHVVANLGKCQDQDDILIKVVPYPLVHVSNDTTVCFGLSAHIEASGGSIYNWSPTTFLSAADIAAPAVVHPTFTVQYIVEVRDVLGCPKPVKGMVAVNVSPEVVANAGPKDTTIVIGEPLQLNGTGGEIYLWSPSQWLSNPVSPNPVANPEGNIQYNLVVKSSAGCTGTDSIKVKVYRVPADIYVPSAFTPNNNGMNDVFKPIPLGMKALTLFRVYNRWGQLVFSTNEIGKGWDGTFHGSPQDAGTYVWMAEGISYEGKIFKRRGYTLLIR